MGILQSIKQWSATHHPRWLVLPRVILGIILIIKGISFIRDAVLLRQLLSENEVNIAGPLLPILITWLHLLCGFLIIIGLFTRWACLLMVPILTVAVVFINAPQGMMAGESEFIFSFLVLVILLFFLVEGGGRLSLDHFFEKYPR